MPQPNTLQSTFQQWGVVSLPNALPKKQIAPIKLQVLKELDQLKIWSSGKIISKKMKELPVFQQTIKLASMLTAPTSNAGLLSPEITKLIQQLSPQGLQLHASPCQLLISPNHQGTWQLQHLNWHTDISASAKNAFGIQVFILLEDVVPQGGGTLALAGSHRYTVAPESRKEVFQWLRNDLATYPLPDSLKLVEMSGKAGDVFLMDMRVLHSPSINASKNLRMMATIRFLEAAYPI